MSNVDFFSPPQAKALALSGEPDEAAAVTTKAVTVGLETRPERTIRSWWTSCGRFPVGSPAGRAAAPRSCGSVRLTCQPVRDDPDHFSLELLAFRVEVSRIVVDSESMLRSVDFDQLNGRGELGDGGAGPFDRDQCVGIAVHDECVRFDLAEDFVRLEPEDFVEKWLAWWPVRR
ncbi:hypothetical protein ACFWPX_02675 [Nocardia sp. NPDC058518]|uniref:hypothetical protein n=1 Tax=Nocardia sp. NPDC058518 TaxID=3346534 RepID=UPI0036614AE9